MLLVSSAICAQWGPDVKLSTNEVDAALRFRTLSGGKALRVIFPDRTDTVILQPVPGEVELDGRKISSTSAVLVRRGDKQEATDLGGQ